jgi:hypothetical protein
VSGSHFDTTEAAILTQLRQPFWHNWGNPDRIAKWYWTPPAKHDVHDAFTNGRSTGNGA